MTIETEHRTALTRRELLAGAATMATLAATGSALGAASDAAMTYRGINYDTGTDYGYPGHLSRMSWHEADVRAELRAIREQLNCNAVQIFGSDHDRLRLATELALEHDLQVWLQPRLMEKPADAQLAHLLEGARFAGDVVRDGGDLILNVGCEATLFQAGIVEGNTYAERIPRLFGAPPEEAGRIAEALDAYLARAVSGVREVFPGLISYGAGSWEAVDWSGFDIAGVNLYRDRSNRANYREVLRGHMANGIPLVVNEFGCSTFEGAADHGAAGFMIVDYSVDPPRIPQGFTRSEEAQALEISELLSIFAEEAVAGTFVFNFLSQFDVHSADPRQDLDMASHAIVKVPPAAVTAPVRWEPKRAFHEVARIYGSYQ